MHSLLVTANRAPKKLAIFDNSDSQLGGFHIVLNSIRRVGDCLSFTGYLLVHLHKGMIRLRYDDVPVVK